MVRNIFLPTPNINKQRLLTTDEQPSLSPGPQPQTHCRRAGSQASVLGSQRVGGWSQHHQCAMRNMDSGSRISLWRKTQRIMTRTQKARADETGRRLLVYTQQRDWPNLNLKSLGEILVPIRLPSVFKQTCQIPHLRLPPGSRAWHQEFRGHTRAGTVLRQLPSGRDMKSMTDKMCLLLCIIYFLS